MNSIGLIGCGKLGICYATLFAKVGFKVYCYEINKTIIEALVNDDYNYKEPNLNELIIILYLYLLVEVKYKIKLKIIRISKKNI